ncbi:hypothetical protein SAMN05216460_0391 [Streptococcus sp. 45]|uniref:Uncharacterized protein n=1 Tax=Streptococcus equinus TaxID=1335 RepID=A0A1H0YZY7_STREI|nr:MULTISPECIES: hypothetical protein [Streptococcus]WFM82237.1 hypothetical protein P7Y79_02765 [Streptococcus ruminicola]SDQ20684.1 hypothetical protein SAMN05216392_0960 [Streptococcus equinus]SEI42869.1 hypothetical protein SAMN05216460_0391 [Streptococcus sp. 45]SFB88372.1 hypothetical protein SAMN05216408_0434 [Streptococcus equinus]
MITYIAKITFFDKTFCIALDLKRVSHPLLEQIKRQVGLVEHDLQIWQEALSDSFKSLASDTFFSKTFFIRALQEHFSDLGKHEAVASITCQTLT